MPIRRTATAALLAGITRAHRLRRRPDPAPAAARHGPTEISVSLFGTFGYEEVGPVRRVRGREPRHHDPVRVDAGRGQVLAGAADPARLGQRRRRRAGHRGRPHRRRRDEPGRPVDRPARRPRRTTPIGRYIDWKEKAATTPDGAVLGLGTDIGPMGICYRTDLLEQAGLPTDPAQLAGADARLGRLPRPRREVQGRRTGRHGLDTTPRAGSTTRSSPPSSRSTTTRRATLVYDVQPGRPPGVRHRRQGRAGRADRQARAVPRPRLGPGLRLRPVRHDRLPVLDDRLHQGQGRRRRRRQVERHRPARRRGRQLGRLLPRASPQPARTRRRPPKLIAWLTAPEQQAKVFAKVGNFPSTTDGHRRGRRRRPTRTSTAPRSARSSPQSATGRARCRSSARRTAS